MFPRCQVRDLSDIPAGMTGRMITKEKYLVAPAKISRAGNVQKYTARELGLDKSKGMDGNKIIRLYRPSEEVFKSDAVASFDRKPLTDGHPPVDVTADTWKDYAIGDVHGVTVAGDCLSAQVIVRDAAAIKAVVDGKAQLSCGYEFDLDMTPGTAPDGQEYDGIQRAIDGNHVAIVDSARAGAGIRIGDRRITTGDSNMITRVIDGITLTFSDETQASVIEKVVKDANARTTAAVEAKDAAEKKAVAAETALGAATKAATDAKTAHDAKVKELEAKILTPEQQTKLVADLTAVIGDAKAIVGDEFKPEGKSIPAIRLEVLTHVIAKDEALKKIALTVLDGMEPAKVDETIARLAFKAVVAARGAGGEIDPAQRQAADEINRALAGDGNPASDGEMSAYELFKFRETHRGMTPEQFAKAEARA